MAAARMQLNQDRKTSKPISSGELIREEEQEIK